jgi:exonuclease III
LSLCSVHMFYGTGSPNDRRRVKEIGTLAELLASRNARRATSPDGEPDTVILLGDFNIFNKKGDKTMQALTGAGFLLPKELTAIPRGTNIARDKYYDQIAFLDPRKRLRNTSRAGVFDFLAAVYSDEDHRSYVDSMRTTDPTKFKRAADKKRYYLQWRTFQMSDHLPMWLELHIDYSQGYLATRGGFHRTRTHKITSRATKRHK